MGPHFMLFQDEEGLWCAVTPGFHNIFLDPIGRGHTPREAVESLKQHPGFQERAREFGWSMPSLSDFVHVSDPDAYIENEPEPPPMHSSHGRQGLKMVSKR